MTDKPTDSAEATDGRLPARACSPSSETPETLDLLNRELRGEPVKVGDWTDLCRKLERDRNQLLSERDRMKKALESVRDTATAMKDSLRCYPKGGTVILAEGPQRIHTRACEALYPENREL